VCFVGYTTVGKTCLVLRFLNDSFEEIDDPTLEDSHRKDWSVGEEQLTLDILDTGGAEEHQYLHKKWFEWADGVVFVYDCHSAYSFDMIPRFRNELCNLKGTKDYPMVLVANQVEGEEASWEITPKEGRSVAYTYRCPFVEASAKTGLGVDSIFANIVKEIRDKRKTAAIDALSAPQKKKGSTVQRLDMTNPKKVGAMQTKANIKPFKSSKKAWVAIKNGVVYVYQKEKDIEEGVPAVALNLLTCTVKPKYGDKKLKNCFELISTKSQFQFVADSPADMMDWITAIQEGIAYMLNENTADKSKLKGNDNRDNIQTWEELKQQPENRACVDCGAPDPDWISINLGLMMCIQCSGVHRSMGVHISKVRSITLDELEGEVQDLMKSLGNRIVNSIWERGLSQATKTKPSPTDDRSTKEIFIRAKYAAREFVVKENLDPDALGQRLYSAASQNNLEGILDCLSQGAQINWTNPEEHHRTALHAAAAAGHTLPCLLLLLNSIEPNTVDDKGHTARALCASDVCAEILLRNGAKGEKNKEEGFSPTPLQSSVSIAAVPVPQSAAVPPPQLASFKSTSSLLSPQAPPAIPHNLPVGGSSPSLLVDSGPAANAVSTTSPTRERSRATPPIPQRTARPPLATSAPPRSSQP